jgi:excisionase family DNA binding protein
MQLDPEFSELLTIKEAAKLINVHPNTLRNWEREGKIQAVRIGSRRDRRYSKSVIWQLCSIPMPQVSLQHANLAV